MAGRGQQEVLRRVVAIRAAQQAAAEMRVARLVRERADLEDRATRLAERQAAEALAWAQAIDARPLDLTRANAWAAAVGTSRADSRALDQLLQASDTDVDHARAELGLALSHMDAAEVRLANEVRRGQRGREEARLGQLADRYAWKAGAP